jgi:hypothetical protein
MKLTYFVCCLACALYTHLVQQLHASYEMWGFIAMLTHVTCDPILRLLNLTFSKYISRRSNSILPSRLQQLPHKIIMSVEYRPTFIMHIAETQFPNQLEESTVPQEWASRVRTSSGSGINTNTYISVGTKTRPNKLLKTDDSCKLLACFPTNRLEVGIQSQCRPCDIGRGGGGSITAA